MIERIVSSLRRIPDFALLILASAIMIAATRFFVGNLLWIGVIYVPILLLFGFLDRYPTFVGALIARRNSFVTITVVLIFSIGVLFYTLSMKRPAPPPNTAAAAFSPAYFASAFFIFGTILGIIFRQSCGGLTYATLLDKRKLELNIRTLGIWGVMVILFPWNQHLIARPWYVLGIGSGIAIHKGLRVALARIAAGNRRILNIAGAWGDKPLEHEEHVALELLKRGRQFPSMKFIDLRKMLVACKRSGKYTKRIALISASVYRLEGNYKAARDESLQFGETISSGEDVYLLLFAAINSAELGDTDRARLLLGKILASDLGKVCPLANTARALWEAEDALATPSNPQWTADALVVMYNVLKFRKDTALQRLKSSRPGGPKTINDVLSRFLEFGTPVTATLYMDVFGYGFLAAGYPDEAFLMFQRCIETDPYYTSAYLHLGDYFLFRRISVERDARPTDRDLWHAAACYQLAQLAERNPESRIRLMAIARSDKVKTMQVPGKA